LVYHLQFWGQECSLGRHLQKHWCSKNEVINMLNCTGTSLCLSPWSCSWITGWFLARQVKHL
jgi:hypothetical protein